MKKNILLAILILLSLLLISCNLGKQPTSASPESQEVEEPVVPEQPTDKPEPEPEPQEEVVESTPVQPNSPPTEQPNGDSIQHLSPGTAVTISEMMMFSIDQGWAIGGTNNSGDHILCTRDGGQTWEDVTPPEIKPGPGQAEKWAKAFFLDMEKGWVIYAFKGHSDVPETPIVWATFDGGQSWQGIEISKVVGMEGFYPSFLTFSDRNNGWLFVSVGAGMSHDYTMAYHTTDGGQSWIQIHNPMESTYLQTCCKTGLVFADEYTGVLTAEQGPYGSVYLDITQDSGMTWEMLNPPVPDADLMPYCISHSPHLFSTTEWLIGMTCRIPGDDGETDENSYVLHTHDGGMSWENRGGLQGNNHFYWFDLNNGLAMTIRYGDASQPRTITRTSSGGAEWQYVSEVFWNGDLIFLDPQTGYAIAQMEDETALVKSVDGGASWMVIEALISSDP
ncbi:MAG: hypothetical protein JEZ06_20260 [Anaerolineaceae bacterium]|nr:hypothetical protein [Anaerolineaceae bacterium]